MSIDLKLNNLNMDSDNKYNIYSTEKLIEFYETMDEVDMLSNNLESMMSTLNNIYALKSVIDKHGLTPGLQSLIPKQALPIIASMEDDNSENKDLSAGKSLIRRIIDAIVKLWKKFIGLFSKVLGPSGNIASLREKLKPYIDADTNTSSIEQGEDGDTIRFDKNQIYKSKPATFHEPSFEDFNNKYSTLSDELKRYVDELNKNNINANPPDKAVVDFINEFCKSMKADTHVEKPVINLNGHDVGTNIEKVKEVATLLDNQLSKIQDLGKLDIETTAKNITDYVNKHADVNKGNNKDIFTNISNISSTVVNGFTFLCLIASDLVTHFTKVCILKTK